MTCSLYACVVIFFTMLMTTMYIINMKLRYSVMSWNWTRILLSGGLNIIIWMRILVNFRASSWARMCRNRWHSAQGHDIPLPNHLKVLSVTLDHTLIFDMHIDSTCLSAPRQINTLKRLARFLDSDSRVLIYKSFVLSNFSYSPITWIFL